MIEPIEIMAPDDAAKFVGLAASTLAKMRMTLDGGPAYFKIGRRVVYDKADLVEWLNAHKVCSKPRGTT